MSQQQNAQRQANLPHLHVATIDGKLITDFVFDPAGQNAGCSSGKKSFLRQLMLDFAVACEMYYPMARFDEIASTKHEDL